MPLCKCKFCHAVISRAWNLKRHQSTSNNCLKIQKELKNIENRKLELENRKLELIGDRKSKLIGDTKINSEIKFISTSIISNKNIDDNLTFTPVFSTKHISEVIDLININTIINENGLSDLYINEIAKNKNGEYGIINTNKKNPIFHIRKKDGSIEKDVGGKLIFKRFISMSTDKIDKFLNEIKKNTNIMEYTRIERNIKNYDKFIKKISYELHIDNVKNNINKDEYWNEDDEKNNELKSIVTEKKYNDKNNSIENILKSYDINKSVVIEKDEEVLLIFTKQIVKKKKIKINHILATQVWDEYIGIKIGEIKCPVCKVNEINQRNFECGHVIPESKGGETKLENLRPLCNKCNKSIGTNEMDKTIWNNIKSIF